MNYEFERPSIVRMPADVFEQIGTLPAEGRRVEVCRRLFEDIVRLFTLNNIEYDLAASSYRIKKVGDIRKKVIRRNSTDPLRDIYGIRVVTEKWPRQDLVEIIQSQYPLTPKKFANGMPSFREYADPDTRDFVRKNFNPNIYHEGGALHVNIVFKRMDSNLYDIAEIQVMNAKEMEIYKATREGYEKERS